jgi:uncharacterized membrane protein
VFFEIFVHPYPFILLNLAFPTEAAYAAPLILLAQTRHADRDKLNAEADAKHREALAEKGLERQQTAVKSRAAGAPDRREHRPDRPGQSVDAGDPPQGGLVSGARLRAPAALRRGPA